MTDIAITVLVTARHGNARGTYSNMPARAVWGDWGLRTRKVDCRLDRIFRYSFLNFSISVSHTRPSPKRPIGHLGLNRKSRNGIGGNFALRQDKLSGMAGDRTPRPIPQKFFPGFRR